MALQVGNENLFGPPEPMTPEFARGVGLFWLVLLLISASGYLWSRKMKAFLAAMPPETRKLHNWLHLGFFASFITHLVWMVATGDGSRGLLVFIGSGCLIASMLVASDAYMPRSSARWRQLQGLALAGLGTMLLYQSASRYQAVPQAVLVSSAFFVVGLLCFYELLRSDGSASPADPVS